MKFIPNVDIHNTMANSSINMPLGLAEDVAVLVPQISRHEHEVRLSLSRFARVPDGFNPRVGGWVARSA